eukprot:CAMPEP_0201584682 /NCGR_PEP_ID=MMETSP0190_2-20130828/113576_1 /ASSEMBLY_ACC=CAM_ASM_000263 /TAXON_ID=37353 /ORGANISM="Rosalina sp." /LENGTH=109 /DNA_ID=CAMNT_0048029115 /DNA_START=108 /DNA_END=434 /DNA_ORIENTATION=+
MQPVKRKDKKRCQWHEVEVTYNAVKGYRGICRTNEWMDCHYDKDCQHPGNNPEHNGAITDITRRLGGVIDNIADDDDFNWPWDCIGTEDIDIEEIEGEDVDNNNIMAIL